MNEKFFSLPEEKRQRIINAGFQVFSMNSYKKSPMSEIANAAGISKSLLFHYFQNKKELYLFLWEECARITIEYLTQYGCYEITDLFDMMYRGMKAKMYLMKRYPAMGTFVIKAYYEKDPAVCQEVQASYQKFLNFKALKAIKKLDPEQFLPGLDLEMMYRQMYLASEGYLLEMIRSGDIDVDRMEQDFIRMMDFWKSVYVVSKDGNPSAGSEETIIQRKEGRYGCNSNQ